MEFTQEQIDSLVVNEVEIMKKIAEELNIRVSQVSAVISLFNEGCTVAFISRYRKDKTDNLDEVQVLSIDHSFKSVSYFCSVIIDVIYCVRHVVRKRAEREDCYEQKGKNKKQR